MAQIKVIEEKKCYNKHNINGSTFYKLRGKIYCARHNRELILITSEREYERIMRHDEGYTCDQCDVDSDIILPFPHTLNCSLCDLDIC